MSEWLKIHSEQAESIEDVAFEIDMLGSSFRRIGNEMLANELQMYALRLKSAQKLMKQAVADHITKSFKQAQDTSATILKSTMTGIELANRDKERGTV